MTLYRTVSRHSCARRSTRRVLKDVICAAVVVASVSTAAAGVTTFPVLNDCQQGDYIDRTAGNPVIEFGGAIGNNYSPRCMTVLRLQPVTFRPRAGASFDEQPLYEGFYPGLIQDVGADVPALPNFANPIDYRKEGPSDYTVVFSGTGYYPFFSFNPLSPEPEGQFGVIQVVLPSEPTDTQTPTATPTPIPASATPSSTRAARCIGDCNGSDRVTLGELVTLVNIALGSDDPSVCPRGVPIEATVDLAVIVRAVNNALNGCGG